MLCVIHVKHDSEDKQTGYWQFECSSCMRNKIAALRAENERLRAIVTEQEGWSTKKDARIAELAALLEPFAAGAEHLPPWAKDDAFVNIDFPYTSDGDFGERWLIDDRVEVRHFKDAAAALKGDTSEIRRRASPDDKHPEDRIVH